MYKHICKQRYILQIYIVYIRDINYSFFYYLSYVNCVIQCFLEISFNILAHVVDLVKVTLATIILVSSQFTTR